MGDRDSAPGIAPFDHIGPCPDCDATGIDDNGDVCRACGGEGRRAWTEQQN